MSRKHIPKYLFLLYPSSNLLSFSHLSFFFFVYQSLFVFLLFQYFLLLLKRKQKECSSNVPPTVFSECSNVPRHFTPSIVKERDNWCFFHYQKLIVISPWQWNLQLFLFSVNQQCSSLQLSLRLIFYLVFFFCPYYQQLESNLTVLRLCKKKKRSYRC